MELKKPIWMVPPGSFSRWTVIILVMWGFCSCIYAREPIFIDVEHAISPLQKAWGLMQRRHLPDNHGMLFHYPKPSSDSFWMLNTYIDLSIAFIDQSGVIREIHELKSHPELMARIHPIRRPQDLWRVSRNNPSVQLFHRESVTPSFDISYALEMPAHWFEKHHVEVGDRLQIDEKGGVVITTGFTDGLQQPVFSRGHGPPERSP